MNPRAGDTVTSTKSKKTTNTTRTTTLTTGVSRAQQGRSNRFEKFQKSRTIGITRKRSRTDDKTLNSLSKLPPHPEVLKPPPEKSRRQSDNNNTALSGMRTSSKSRLGDFFSNLASRIRGPKTADTMPVDHAEDPAHEAITVDVDVANSSTEESVMKELGCSYTDITKISMKREGNNEPEQNVDYNKRRKVDIDEDRSESSSVTTIKSNYVNEPDKFNISSMHTDDCEASTSDCKNYIVENTNSEQKDKVIVDNKCDLTNQLDSEPKSQTKNYEPGESRILDFCKSIISTIGERIQNVEAIESVADEKTKVSNNIKSRSFVFSKSEKSSREENCLKSQNKLGETNTSTTNIGAEADPPTELTSRSTIRSSRKDETARLRKTIQWLEEGGRRLREELAGVRAELHEERKASRLARRNLEIAIKEAKNAESVKYTGVISELKARLSASPTRSDSTPNISKTNLLKDENHKREMAALKKRLAEAETTIQKLKINSLDRSRSAKRIKEDGHAKTAFTEVRRLEIEVQNLRAVNKEIEERLHIAEESARVRAAELRTQHEQHEAEMSSLQKALRSDTIKMMDEIQSKNREIEKLEKLVNESEQHNKKLRDQEDKTMRKLRESERSHQIRLAPRIEEKIHHDDHMMDLCKVECEDNDAAAAELDRLRELAVEQRQVIEVLRQAVKEKERKLEQLTNKRRKEEFYKQWLELEPVAEVDDEDEQQNEEGDSALSSAPSSLSPQPGAGRNNGITREAYESVLLEIEELQTKLIEEQQELGHAKSQVRELEKALLQETRGSQNSRRALSEKLRDAEEREAGLVAEISELREQNELLEFRVLELEESPNLRDTPDPADSGIVSPEPIHLYKDHHQSNKHRDRAVATVIPYNSNYSHPILPNDPQKAPLSLQESGIFEEDDDEDHVEDHIDGIGAKIELSSQSTQTEAPAGELLQEVQRLQELRARIQERGAKIPPLSPISDRKNDDAPHDFPLDVVTPLREKIRQLEERLSSYESERKISKQREEELLDENYRLTENTYCLEAELRKLREKINEVKLTSDAITMTDKINVEFAEVQTEIVNQDQDETDNKLEEVMNKKDSTMSRCQILYQAAVENLVEDRSCSNDERTYNAEFTVKSQPCLDCSEIWKDCDSRIRNLARTEFCLRQQIASLEHRESAFFETLRQADVTWARLEADYEVKQREMTERLNAQVELNKALFEHLTKLNKSIEDKKIVVTEEPMEVDDDVNVKKLDLAKATQTDEIEECRCKMTNSLSRSSSSATGVIVRADSNRVSTISRTSIKLDCDEIDTKMSSAREPPTEVATEAKEDDPSSIQSQDQKQCSEQQQEQQEQPEALVSIDESSSDKKQIIYFRWR